MQILYSRCYGIDVNKDSVTVCAREMWKMMQPESREEIQGKYF